MPLSLEEISLHLSCPDDRATLRPYFGGLRCARCDRSYRLHCGNILELLPSRPIACPEASKLKPYREGYQREFSRPLEIREEAEAWGAPEALPRMWGRLRARQAREALQFLRGRGRESELIYCDLSAGAGYCTFEAAQEYRLVFHCDLSVDSLAYASAKAKANQLENIVFVRADYFQPPFRNSVHRLTCLDTLIRGPWHEKRLLRSIQAVLANSGVAVVDFHNWWHNPLRRLGFLRDNFSGNKSYTRKELGSLLANSGIAQFQMQPFVQEMDPEDLPGKVFARFIPPTRLMVRLMRGNEPQMQTGSRGSQESRT
jgi:SAM-dependent methyltransferase